MNAPNAFTVMVVDDVEINIDILVDALGQQYEVLVAMDGNSAIEDITAHSPDLVLLDIMMPGLDGIEVCKRLKKLPKTRDIPVIFLTAKTDNKSIVAGFEAGGVDYISKPFNKTELLIRVKTHLELNHSRKELEKFNKKLEFLAIHDDLTGLYNTRYLYDALSGLIEYSRAEKVPFTLLFMDIDNFKSVVDTHGHLNGSRAIQEVAQTIQDSISDPSYGVAYGGDEFVVVLPGADKIQALVKTEQIRKSMKQKLYLHEEGCKVRLSASYGIATFPDDATEVKTLLNLADQAMFRIKETTKGAIGCS